MSASKKSRLPRRPYEGQSHELFSDLERALADIDSDVASTSMYSPADPSAWGGSTSLSIFEALDRIATALGPFP